VLNPMNAVGRRTQEGKVLRRPARQRDARTGSGTPREEGAIWRMTRVGRAESQRRRLGGTGRARA
jgi:hypothetical protein